MSTDLAELERGTLDRLRDDFESKGYRFLLEPGPDDMPEFLGGYQPDALALRPDDNVVIQVKARGARDIRMPLAQLAARVPSGSGWRYMLVYAGQDPSDVLDLPRSNRAQIDTAIVEARELEKQGFYRAAMLEAWSILEALARRLDVGNSPVSSRPLSAMHVVEKLAMEGEIDAEQAKRLRSLSSLRNAVAHGDLDARVASDDARFLLELLEGMDSG